MGRYGSGTVYRRGRTWWIQYLVGGRRYRESSRSASKADAVKLLRQRLAAADVGAVVLDAERVTFEDLREWLRQDYAAKSRRSWDRAAQAFVYLGQAFAGWRAADLRADHLAQYVERRLAEASVATVAYELAVLKRAFNVAIERGRLATRPRFPRLRPQNARDQFIEDAEFDRLREALPEYLRGMATFAWLTGWRKREVLGLTWDNVDFQAGAIRLRVGTTKNAEGRVLPFAALPALREVLERQRAYTDTIQRVQGCCVPYVFHHDGRPIRDFYAAWRTACRAAGVLDATGRPKVFHDFRRSAVRRLERAGVPRAVAMRVTGHKTASVYERYAIVRESDLAEGLAKVADLLDRRSGTKVSHFELQRRVGRGRR